MRRAGPPSPLVESPRVRVMDRVIVRLLPTVPRPVVQRLSAPYIAGSTLDDARRTVAGLNAEGKLATVDVLGEEVTKPAEAEAVASAYHAVLDAIGGDQLDSSVSVKLTALGLKIDLDLCRSLLATVVADASARGIFVRIDMEDSTCTDDTFTLYRELRGARRDVGDRPPVLPATHGRRRGRSRGAAAERAPVQGDLPRAAVHRVPKSRRDPRGLRPDSGRAARGGVLYQAVATHDEWLLERALERVRGMRREDYELQVLLGVRERRASELVAEGHRLRVWCPTATAGTVSPSGVCRRTRRSRRCSRRRPPAASSRAARGRCPSTAGGLPAVDDQRLAADHRRVRRAEERHGSCDVLRRDEPPDGIYPAEVEHRLLAREVVESARLDDACRDRVHRDPAWGELDREVADQRLERGLRGAHERVVLGDRVDSRLERATIAEPSGIEGAAARVRERNARAFADSVQSQCFSSVSSAGRMTPVAAAWTKTSIGPRARDLLRDARGRDVAAHEDDLDAELAELGRGLLRSAVPACTRARSVAPRGTRSGARSPSRSPASRR